MNRRSAPSPIRPGHGSLYPLPATAVHACHDHAPGLSYDPTQMTIGSWAMAHGIAALTVDGPLAKWITSPDDLTDLATAIIHNTAESVYRASSVTGPAAVR
jgi:hypothetical protein